ncbi:MULTISPECIES: helix-turn-helix domain-containing protein [Rugamonas]|uniref:Helix-turn-helix domain-containing protein n=2 Tax=Rugamonas TaxID=212744 RepID=A0A843SFM0_9BURK|nr:MULTISPECIES: helix-turn-helix domain-containing protein [Rugamonas]MQA20930.1 helix-turn-helix domain-containing protein [Rugamonas rivuli]MQA42142.1 helix-turn-helix domain-containing protein [Rugamonas aquatica]
MFYFYTYDGQPPPSATSAEERAAYLRKAIGHEISTARQRAGLTQESVAELLGIGPEAVSRMERGVGSVNAERLVVLGEMFGCSSADMLLGASDSLPDQAVLIAQQLAKLDSADRDMVADLVKTLARRLEPKKPGKPKR